MQHFDRAAKESEFQKRCKRKEMLHPCRFPSLEVMQTHVCPLTGQYKQVIGVAVARVVVDVVHDFAWS